MATVQCLKCKDRPAIDSCTICNNPLCGECLVRCQVCKKTVCKKHHDVTTTGRKLCDVCMQRRTQIRAERKERKEKERERQPAENLSFESLSDKTDAPIPAREAPSTSFEPDDEMETSSADSPSASTSFAPEPSEEDDLRMPIDMNRPILTASASQRSSKWVYVVPAIIGLVIMYFVVTEIFVAFSFF